MASRSVAALFPASLQLDWREVVLGTKSRGEAGWPVKCQRRVADREPEIGNAEGWPGREAVILVATEGKKGTGSANMQEMRARQPWEELIHGRKVLGHVGERKVEVPLGMEPGRGLGKYIRLLYYQIPGYVTLCTTRLRTSSWRPVSVDECAGPIITECQCCFKDCRMVWKVSPTSRQASGSQQGSHGNEEVIVPLPIYYPLLVWP
ncbi:hypothetical protein B0T20DRAFT_388876 [Sordaria brevicollis]|uniref:Uncharacterized protein n=1 Tax=Sordaria brevicollis TaxID=83679 RepID=A0AAE0PNJ5_SORBR|nr:hypothetical protein B0T20DRAFT_388876 [Sordaria brevicollis]